MMAAARSIIAAPDSLPRAMKHPLSLASKTPGTLELLGAFTGHSLGWRTRPLSASSPAAVSSSVSPAQPESVATEAMEIPRARRRRRRMPPSPATSAPSTYIVPLAIFRGKFTGSEERGLDHGLAPAPPRSTGLLLLSAHLPAAVLSAPNTLPMSSTYTSLPPWQA